MIGHLDGSGSRWRNVQLKIVAVQGPCNVAEEEVAEVAEGRLEEADEEADNKSNVVNVVHFLKQA